jgi:methylenetetrahydrofolate dehydrogenase (NADP+)/methenyltetrahydrofolate cyclohydrolase
MTTLLDGTPLARSIREHTAHAAGTLTTHGRPPKLAVLVATDDESTAWYVRSIAKAARQTAIACDIIDLGPTASTEDIHAALLTLNQNPHVHGIILQTPYPPTPTPTPCARPSTPPKTSTAPTPPASDDSSPT